MYVCISLTDVHICEYTLVYTEGHLNCGKGGAVSGNTPTH